MWLEPVRWNSGTNASTAAPSAMQIQGSARWRGRKRNSRASDGVDALSSGTIGHDLRDRLARLQRDRLEQHAETGGQLHLVAGGVLDLGVGGAAPQRPAQ